LTSISDKGLIVITEPEIIKERPAGKERRTETVENYYKLEEEQIIKL
jgi:hypothetical protein